MTLTHDAFLFRTKRIIERLRATCVREDELLLAAILDFARDEAEDAIREHYLSRAYEERLPRSTSDPPNWVEMLRQRQAA